MSEDPKRRMSFLMPQATVDRLEALKTQTEAATYTDVVRASLRTYEAIVTELLAGKSVVIRDQDGSERPLVLI